MLSLLGFWGKKNQKFPAAYPQSDIQDSIKWYESRHLFLCEIKNNTEYRYHLSIRVTAREKREKGKRR